MLRRVQLPQESKRERDHEHENHERGSRKRFCPELFQAGLRNIEIGENGGLKKGKTERANEAVSAAAALACFVLLKWLWAV